MYVEFQSRCKRTKITKATVSPLQKWKITTNIEIDMCACVAHIIKTTKQSNKNPGGYEDETGKNGESVRNRANATKMENARAKQNMKNKHFGLWNEKAFSFGPQHGPNIRKPSFTKIRLRLSKFGYSFVGSLSVYVVHVIVVHWCWCWCFWSLLVPPSVTIVPFCFSYII